METPGGTEPKVTPQPGSIDELRELLARALDQVARSGGASERLWRKLDTRVGALTPREHRALLDSYDRP